MTEPGRQEESLPLNENGAAFDLSPSAVTPHLHRTFPKTTINVTSKAQSWVSTVKNVFIPQPSPSNKTASVVRVGSGESTWKKFLEFYVIKKALG